MDMEYRVTFKNIFGTALVLLIIGCSLIAAGILQSKFFLFLFGLMFLAWPFAVCYRLKIVVGDDRIAYTGFLATKVIKFADIIHTGWMFEHGYSRDRLFGSLSYEILSKETSVRINFRLFSVDSMKNVIDMLESLPKKSPSAGNT
jgi:hypothetical protein